VICLRFGFVKHRPGPNRKNKKRSCVFFLLVIAILIDLLKDHYA
jgi:hypothetical protein